MYKITIITSDLYMKRHVVTKDTDTWLSWHSLSPAVSTCHRCPVPHQSLQVSLSPGVTLAAVLSGWCHDCISCRPVLGLVQCEHVSAAVR